MGVLPGVQADVGVPVHHPRPMGALVTKKISKLELKEAVRQEMFEYLDFRERQGRPLTYPALLRARRDETRQNWLDDGDPAFRDRFEVLDELCVQEGIA